MQTGIKKGWTQQVIFTEEISIKVTCYIIKSTAVYLLVGIYYESFLILQIL